eukprot:scaffold183_cov249-Pinguiococcus_pyrenoidosus.AAC.16
MVPLGQHRQQPPPILAAAPEALDLQDGAKHPLLMQSLEDDVQISPAPGSATAAAAALSPPEAARGGREALPSPRTPARARRDVDRRAHLSSHPRGLVSCPPCPRATRTSGRSLRGWPASPRSQEAPPDASAAALWRCRSARAAHLGACERPGAGAEGEAVQDPAKHVAAPPW